MEFSSLSYEKVHIKKKKKEKVHILYLDGVMWWSSQRPGPAPAAYQQWSLGKSVLCEPLLPSL